MIFVERIDLSSLGRGYTRPNVVAADYVVDINLMTSTLSSCTCSFEG
jgi:hypothetical protein